MITNFPSTADRMKTRQCGCMELVHEECPHLQPVPTMYGYQGQSHQAGLRQGQLPSQFGSALGQSQPGLGPEHRNPSDSNLSGSAQANHMWPNSY